MVKVAAADHLEVVVEVDHLMADQGLVVEAVDRLVQVAVVRVRAHLVAMEVVHSVAQGLAAEALEVAPVHLHHKLEVKAEVVLELAVEVMVHLRALRHRPADKVEAALALDRLADRVDLDQVQVVEVDRLVEAVALYPSEALFQSEVAVLDPAELEAVAAALLALEAGRLAEVAVALDQELSILAVLELNWTLIAIVLELVTMLLCSVVILRSKFWSRPTGRSTVASTLSAAVKLAT